MRLKFILYPALSLLARLRLPRVAARVLALSMRPFPENLPSRSGASASYRVLVLNLNKPGFPGDIEESLLGDPAFEVVSWPNYALKAMASAILAPQLSNRRYASDDPAVEASKLQFRQFLLALWQRFCELRPIDAVITANFGYFAQHEFGAALKQAGTPLVVLHKENVKSPERVEYWRAIYRTRGAFEGSKILVYSDAERDLQVETGVATLEQIAVTGMPRMDRIHRWRKDHATERPQEAPQVLFFSFWRKEKLTDMERVTDARVRIDVADGEWARLSWTELCEGTHKAVVELAKRNPQARVVVKTKAQSRRVDDSLNLLRQFAGELPPNLSVVSGGDPFSLIVASSVVIGFNTTALLEALAAGKPVIVPQFGEADDPRMRPLVIDVGDAVERARSPEEIVERAGVYLNAAAPASSGLRPAAAKALTHWVGNDDGHAGRRVREAVRDEIMRTRQGNATSDAANRRRAPASERVH